MTGEILQAIIDEGKAVLSGTGAQLMLRTNFIIKETPDHTGNFVLLAIEDASGSGQYPGGLTQMDWRWNFGSYNYEPDSYVDDPSTYSTSLLNFIDLIRVHFSSAGLYGGTNIDSGTILPGVTYRVINGSVTYNGNLILKDYYFIGVDGVADFTTLNGGSIINTVWLTPGMANIFNIWGFQFTMTGLTTADPIDEDGIIMGYKIGFDSTALDDQTLYVREEKTCLEVEQIDNPPFTPHEPIS